ncbi:MAG: hypothetical protein IKB07_12640 [Lachnospiraceae bacterium]|nr:hypothetical protein [Lachnospiraceae bacterium]
MKNGKVKRILYYLSAVLYWLLAIFTFTGDKNVPLGVGFLCLGVMMLLFGITESNDSKKEKAENKDE